MPTARALTLVVLFAACGAADARESLVSIDSLPGGIPVVTTSAPIDSGMWSLVHERDVQPANGADGEILHPRDIALADDGILIISESRPAALNLYDPQGNFLRTISREGDGPGEFRVGYIASRGDTIVVQDGRRAQATSFLRGDGSAMLTRATSCCLFAPIAIDSQGRAWNRMIPGPEALTGPGIGFVRYPIGALTAETLVVLGGGPRRERPVWQVGEGDSFLMSEPVPMVPIWVFAVHHSGSIITGWGGEYRLRFTSDGVDTVRVFARPWTPDPVLPAEKQELVDRRIRATLASGYERVSETLLREAFDQAMIPDQRPAFEQVWGDPVGRIWVRLPKADTMAVHLDLFDANGQWLDQLRVAEPGWARSNRVPLSFNRTHVALALEDDRGLPFVRIFRIVRTND